MCGWRKYAICASLRRHRRDDGPDSAPLFNRYGSLMWTYGPTVQGGQNAAAAQRKIDLIFAPHYRGNAGRTICTETEEACYHRADLRGQSLATLCAAPTVGQNQIGDILLVTVRDNNIDQALKFLKKKMQREGIFREMKLRSAYEKPSERRVREKAEAIRRARKLARKTAIREGLVAAPKPKTPAHGQRTPAFAQR
jgi:small subunit ribosomal protein S21